MNFVYLIILLIITAGTLFNSIKWGRFAQREHYLPGSVTKFYFRWIRTKFINRFMFFISLILFVVSLWVYYVPLLVVCLTIFSPLGINFKSRTGEIVITGSKQITNKTAKGTAIRYRVAAADANDQYIGDMGVGVHGILSVANSGTGTMTPTITLYVG